MSLTVTTVLSACLAAGSGCTNSRSLLAAARCLREPPNPRRAFSSSHAPAAPPRRAGVFGWCAWLFSIIAGGLLFFTNTFLLVQLRRATRGGAARGRLLIPTWLRRHRVLLPLIKLLL